MGKGDAAGGRAREACRYGACRTPFRGPPVPLDGPYVAVLGGCEAHGADVDEPFPVRLALRTGRRVVNLGVPNGGLDVFAGDADLLAVAAGAEAVVIQALGAVNLSNRFYTVHPRRNDRFLRQSPVLAALYPEVDFSEVAFTGHLVATLLALCPRRFEQVAGELREAWVARMRMVASALPGRRVVLDIRAGGTGALGPRPVLVTGDMLGRLRDCVDDVVTCDVAPGSAGPSPAAHDAIAATLAAALGLRDGLAA